jgi:hypothetical protein
MARIEEQLELNRIGDCCFPCTFVIPFKFPKVVGFSEAMASNISLPFLRSVSDILSDLVGFLLAD